MQNFGIRDIPVESIEQESLGLGRYVDSLSEFITACETPMTISIQGDWGCGKTSAMNMIKEKISDRVVPIWFNTWQFSQFDMQRELSISLLSYFVSELDDKEATFKKKIGGVLKGLGKMTAAVIAEQTLGETMAGKIADAEGEAIDSAKALKNLKIELQKAVEQKLKAANRERVVVFIDDLDRLQPEKAVETLEVMKLFLDVPYCVFVLAVDYGVVVRGVRKKYGEDIGDEKGRSFFDKIIQLPFNLPVSQYNLDTYFRGLLEKTGIDFGDLDIRIYESLASSSIGINPRGLKRIFNLMLLLNITAKNQNLLENADDVKKSERQRVMFAALCLQSGFEEAYQFLAKSKITEDFLRKMSDANQLKNSELFEGLRKVMLNDEKLEKLAEFMEIFIDSLQTDFDGNDGLSALEIKNLSEILKFSSITAVDDGKNVSEVSYEERKQNRDAIKAFVEELNGLHKLKFKSLKAKFIEPKFLIYQPRDENYAVVYIQIDNGGAFEICFLFDNSYMEIYEANSSKNGSKAAISFINQNFKDFGFSEINTEAESMYSEDFKPSMTFEQKMEKFKAKTKGVTERIFEALER